MVKSTQDSTSLTLRGVDLLNLCHRSCENQYEGDKLLTKINRSLCKVNCNRVHGAPEYHSQEPTLSEELAAIASDLSFDSKETCCLW